MALCISVFCVDISRLTMLKRNLILTRHVKQPKTHINDEFSRTSSESDLLKGRLLIEQSDHKPQGRLWVRHQLPWWCNHIKIWAHYPNIPLLLIIVTSECLSLTLAGGRLALWAAMLTMMHLHPPSALAHDRSQWSSPPLPSPCWDIAKPRWRMWRENCTITRSACTFTWHNVQKAVLHERQKRFRTKSYYKICS